MAEPDGLIVTQCLYCRHYSRVSPAVPPGCRAFPGGIPDAILTNSADHRQPFEDDQGVRFEPRDTVPPAILSALFKFLDAV